MSNSIYKFFPYNAHDLDALANNYLWFSHYSNFNDPFEDIFINNALVNNDTSFDLNKAIKMYKLISKDRIEAHVIEQEILEMMEQDVFERHYHETMSKTFEGTQNEFDRFVAESKACCFARDSIFGPALENRLMWSHYADGLRGFCVEYDKNMLIRGISEHIGQEVLLSPMNYGELKTFNFSDILLQTAQSIDLNDKMFGIGSIACFKSKEWEYESEFRLVTDVANSIEIPPQSILSITVGAKMPPLKLNTLKSILRGNQGISCEVHESYIDTKTFKLGRRYLDKINP
ncbi:MULTISPECIES: DUF2971 domain-containing protein [Vibrio]|uniref:DUF2971 domain-containing protein n=1 Tax=Vibrio TaxID=662 RepID=UPI0006372D4D|nr:MULTISPECIES: DUF2971 domain-containing protein [Vibrio]ROQ87665.1 DUF2971 family protein [Vibrio crassostreae]CDU14906.1 conserved hypothetical protein [Vibrio coralliirubri]